MRGLALLAVVVGCGDTHTAPHTPAPPSPVAAKFAAAQFVPGKPTYVFSARTLGDAQLAVRDAIDALGLVADTDASDASSAFEHLIAVDALSPDPVAAIGIDVQGGVAVFSENVDPTVILHLTAPEAFAAFVTAQRARGLATRSVIVDGVEVFTAALGGGASLSWAIDRDWLWTHFRLVDPDDTSWFTHSHHPDGASWTADWDWAAHAGAATASRVLGYIGVRDVFAHLVERVPAAVACARLVEPVGRAAVGLGLGTNGQAPGVRLALDLGDSARGVERMVMPPPPGWTNAAAQAPLAVQWNLDLDAAAAWIAPCGQALGIDLGEQVRGFGVRAGRVLLQTFDPDGPSGTGAVALDVSSSKFFAAQLDRIPGRRFLESDRKFGALSGKHISVPFPFKVTLDYVLGERVALAAVGDGLLDRLVAGGAPIPVPTPPIMAIDVQPSRLSPVAWTWLLDLANVPQPRRVAQRLAGWNDAHLTTRLDHDSLVLEIAGHRR